MPACFARIKYIFLKIDRCVNDVGLIHSLVADMQL